MENKKFAVADRYSDCKYLEPLSVGDTVRVQPLKNNKTEWKQATVSKKLSSHSFEVSTDDGKIYRRNRQFLRKSVRSRDRSPEVPLSNHSYPSSTAVDSDNLYSPNINTQSPNKATIMPSNNSESDTSDIKTRSGRTVRAPVKLNL